MFREVVLSIALAFGLVEAHANEPSVAFNCIPIPQSGSKETDPIVSVEVRVSGSNWRVSHISSNGFRYERTMQYSLRDTSTQSGLSWAGTYYNAPNLRMTGQVIGVGGQPAYVEELYNSHNNALVASTRAQCTALSAAQVNPMETPRFNSDRNQVGFGEAAVSLHPEGGVFTVPGTINGQITLDFIVDSGASDVSIPKDVVSTLIRTRTITDADFQGSETYRLADGSTVPSQTLVIRSLKVGTKVLENVAAHIAPNAGQLLLGQSFLKRFRSWSIDNDRTALILNGDPIQAENLQAIAPSPLLPPD